jgi:hypothetical protein
MKIMKYRQLARSAVSDPETTERIAGLVAEMEQKLREIDEQGRLSRVSSSARLARNRRNETGNHALWFRL